MTINVEIADRLYDYTDEEKAAAAVADYQAEMGLDDVTVMAIWNSPADPRRDILDRKITEAVDANGSAKRAQESVPGGVTLFID